jgi:hypothetical protein
MRVYYWTSQFFRKVDSSFEKTARGRDLVRFCAMAFFGSGASAPPCPLTEVERRSFTPRASVSSPCFVGEIARTEIFLRFIVGKNDAPNTCVRKRGYLKKELGSK